MRKHCLFIVSDKLFVGGSFTYNHRGSIYYNEFTKSGYDRRDDYSCNFNLRYLPSANWSLALNVKTENDNDRGSYPWVTSYDSVFAKPYQVNSNNANVERRNNFNTSLAANYYGKRFNFTSVSSYIDYHGYNMLLYASYARGFRAGGLNTNAPTPAQVPYEPEHSDNYEIGWKNMLLNNKLKLNLTVFYLEQHNQQISTSMDGLNQLILNVGEMHNKGAELEVTTLPVKGLQIDWNASYSYARYTSLLLFSTTANQVVNYKGNQPINNPPISSMLATQYTYPFKGSKQRLAAFVRGEYRYLSKYYFDFINGYGQPSYSLFNAKAGVSTKHFELDGWIRNITDRKYIPYGSFGTFLLGTPRTYGLTLIAKI